MGGPEIIQSWSVNGSSEFKRRECKNIFELIKIKIEKNELNFQTLKLLFHIE